MTQLRTHMPSRRVPSRRVPSRRVPSRRTLSLSALTLLSALVPLGAACSSAEKIECGPGTVLQGNTCVLDDDQGLGGMGGGAAPTPDLHQADIDLIKREFTGATAAGPASTTSAVVAWNASSLGSVSYNIYVSTKADKFSFGTPQHHAPAGSNSFEVTGLEKGETYYITVRAVLFDRELPHSFEPVKVTTSADSKAPSFAGVLKAKAAGGAAVKLSWDSANDDLSPDGAISYLVYYGTTPDFGSVENAEELRVPFAVSAPGATSVTVSGLPAPETEYYFIVRARDAAGNIDDNIVTAAGTSGPDTSAPAFAGCDIAIERNASAIDVFWRAAIDDTTTPEKITYNVYASTTPDGHNFSQPTQSGEGGESLQVTGLKRDQKYYLICRAEDASGNEEENTRTQSARTKKDGEPPEFGGIIATANLGANSVDLQWNEAIDVQTVAEDMVYDVFVADAEDGFDFESAPLISSEPGATAVTVSELNSNTAYFFQVLARDLAGNQSEPAAAQTVTTLVSLLTDVQLPIFSSKCAISGCHAGGSPQFGLSLAQGISHGLLVNVPSLTTGADRIEPGFPDSSHLIERIESDGSVYLPMPQNSDLLSQAEIDTIRLWITQGALNN